MKRFILILTCLAILYAGAVWALEGCGDFGTGPNAQNHDESGAPSHHDADSAAHHSHSDQSTVHCPNVFGEFLLSSRVSVKSNNGGVWCMAQLGEPIHSHVMAVTARGSGNGPPGSVHSKDFPRYLVLSVIRI